MRESDARYALLDAVRRLDAAGLNVNASGNASTRVGEHLLVTPSGIPAAALRHEDMVLIDLDGRTLDDDARPPTSEWRIHVGLARARSDVTSVVHIHSPEATAASTMARAVPAVHYVVARFGGPDLACAPYATYGTGELADRVIATLGSHRTACLMANHGAITVADDLSTAVSLAHDVEWFCGVHRRAIASGDPVVLDADEITRVAERFRSYGRRERNAD